MQLTLTITLSSIAESPLAAISSPGIGALDSAVLAVSRANFVLFRMSSTCSRNGKQPRQLMIQIKGNGRLAMAG